MDMPHAQAPQKVTAFDVLLFWLAAIDKDTLRQCPQHDWDNARAVGSILLFVLIFEATLFSIIGHRLFAAPGEVRLDLILVGIFLGGFIVQIDSYVVVRSSWHLSGIEELKSRGGLDISGGPWARIKANFFLAIRILLSIGLAQLTAIFLSLIIFASDEDSRIMGDWRQANAHLIVGATQPVDDEIQRTTDAVAAQKVGVASLSNQVNTLHQYEVDPASGDPQVSQAQQEVTQLLAQKTRAEEDLRAAETFAANEMAGIKAVPGNSGRAGPGPRRKAALEQVTNARNHAQEASRALEDARARLDVLRRQQQGASLEAKRQQAHDQLPIYEKRLAEENAKLASLNDELNRLTRGRGDAIRANIEKAPDHVPLDNGLLAQIRILDEIAQRNPKIMAVIALIDLVSFSLELAAVLAKVTSYVPTTYAMLLARDAYLAAVRTVDEMVKELNPEPSTYQKEPAIVMPREPANDNWPAHEQAVRQNPFNGPDDPPPPPPKRKRGRPRKTPPAVV